MKKNTHIEYFSKKFKESEMPDHAIRVELHHKMMSLKGYKNDPDSLDYEFDPEAEEFIRWASRNLGIED